MLRWSTLWHWNQEIMDWLRLARLSGCICSNPCAAGIPRAGEQGDWSMPTQLQKISKTPQPLWAVCTSATSPTQHTSAAWHLDRTSCVLVRAICLLSLHWAPLERAWLSPFCNLPSGIYRHLWDPPWASLLPAEQSQIIPLVLIGEILQYHHNFLGLQLDSRGCYSMTEHCEGNETASSILCTFRKQAVTLPSSSCFLLEAAKEEGCSALTIPMWLFSFLFFLCFAEILWHNYRY